MTDSDLDPVRFGTAFKAFMDAVVASANPPTSPLLERIAAHLGGSLSQLAVIAEAYDPFEHPNLQRALDAYIVREGRRSTLVGIGLSNKRHMHMGLSDLLAMGDGPVGRFLDEGPVDYANFHLADGEVLSCVDLGLYFIHDGDTPLLALVAGVTDHGPRQKLSLEVVARRPEQAQAFLAEITASMDRLNVYRGHVIALSPGEFGPGRQTLIAFPRLPRVTRQDVILPTGLLDRIERHTVVFSQQAERLRAAGRSLKRGLLLYGPPGVGKTLTVEYLASRMPGRTTILTAGMNMALLQPAVHLARKLAPAMVVLEDVDLIAEERGMPFGHSGPLLFSLLNEMDGLQEDSDVIFVLTTNRPDILEPALAARPGRIDLAVEYPIPNTGARLRLMELYARGLDLQDVHLAEIAERIAGATPAYIKELLRKAAVVAAEGDETVITQAHLETALTELDAGGELAHRLLGFRTATDAADRTQSYPPRPDGFPSGFPPHRVSTG